MFSLRSASTPEPVTASIRLTPAATEFSETILKRPIFAVLSTCVPPQNSTEKSPALTTLTISPYFSPNRAIAPSFLASSIGISLVSTGKDDRIISFTLFSTAAISSVVSALKCEKSKRHLSGPTS